LRDGPLVEVLENVKKIRHEGKKTEFVANILNLRGEGPVAHKRIKDNVGKKRLPFGSELSLGRQGKTSHSWEGGLPKKEQKKGKLWVKNRGYHIDVEPAGDRVRGGLNQEKGKGRPIVTSVSVREN